MAFRSGRSQLVFLTLSLKVWAPCRAPEASLLFEALQGFQGLEDGDGSTNYQEILEQGPPESICEAFQRLFGDKIEATKAANEEARRKLKWPP